MVYAHHAYSVDGADTTMLVLIKMQGLLSQPEAEEEGHPANRKLTLVQTLLMSMVLCYIDT